MNMYTVRDKTPKSTIRPKVKWAITATQRNKPHKAKGKKPTIKKKNDSTEKKKIKSRKS